MKKLRFLGLLLCVMSYVGSLEAKSLSFGQDSPFEYFQKNPLKAAQFIKDVETNKNLTSEQVDAYKALLGMNDEMAGDVALEILDSSEVSWFYGWESGNSNSENEDSLWNAARVTPHLGEAEFRDCLSRAMCVMVSKSSQRLYAFIDGQQIKVNDAGKNGVNWQAFARVSTARPGKVTPEGLFTVQELAHSGRTSFRYPGAGLFYAMQIHGNIFIHGTNTSNYGNLGTRASAGCIRTRWEVSENLNLNMREIGGRSSGVLANPNTIRVIVAESVPDQFLVVY